MKKAMAIILGLVLVISVLAGCDDLEEYEKAKKQKDYGKDEYKGHDKDEYKGHDKDEYKDHDKDEPKGYNLSAGYDDLPEGYGKSNTVKFKIVSMTDKRGNDYPEYSSAGDKNYIQFFSEGKFKYTLFDVVEEGKYKVEGNTVTLGFISSAIKNKYPKNYDPSAYANIHKFMVGKIDGNMLYFDTNMTNIVFKGNGLLWPNVDGLYRNLNGLPD